MNDTHSPKLKEAMAEIKAILTKHDIAAHVVLHEPGFSEFLLAVEPSWSVLRFNGSMLRVRSVLQEDFNGDAEAKRQADEATANLVEHFKDLLLRHAGIFDSISRMLAERWKTEHSERVLTPHRDH